MQDSRIHLEHIAVLLPDSLRLSRAVETAVKLAEREKARLTVLVPGSELERTLARHTLDVDTLDQLVSEHDLARNRHLDELLAGIRPRVAQVSYQVVSGRRRHEAILEWMQARRPDLLVKDIGKGSRRVAHLFTPLDWHLMRGSPCPLMLLGRGVAHGPVVAALDLVGAREKPLSLDQQVMTWGQWLSDWQQCPLHTVHAFETVENLRLPFGMDRLMPEDDLKRVETEHRQLLDRASASVNVPEQNRHLIHSPPGRAIPALCDELDARMLVLGTARRGRLERLVMGSTAESIIHALDGDLLAIPPID
ncbi:universal stress protein [Natronospira bacteriovora]|uniref:Universal stress protein n=1 Tax=Natronospira bacteriovora TaxID=3069753 RepID=A0ABU0W3T3_9GAMM|nr:universal stress protein [Natronospira sp. AB-CW4]MDQ2068690.1 universal stress protein [Natronospira sp. AB-CW4]